MIRTIVVVLYPDVARGLSPAVTVRIRRCQSEGCAGDKPPSYITKQQRHAFSGFIYTCASGTKRTGRRTVCTARSWLGNEKAPPG